MAMTVAELVATLRADTANFVRGMHNASESLGGLQTMSQKANKLAHGVQSVLGGVTAAAAGLATAGVAMGVAMNATLEKSTLQFETLMGDADKARKHVAMLFQFAKRTPFETGPIIQASRMLQTFGKSALNTEANIKRVGDASAAVSAPIEEVSFWVGRAYSMIQAGKPFGEAAMRLQELAVLSAEARNKMESLRETGASTQEVWAVFTQDLDKFKGAMEKQAETWEGLKSTIMDIIKLGAADVFKPLFDSGKKAMKSIIAITDTEKFEAWKNKLTAAVTKIVARIESFAVKAKDAAGGLTGFFKDMTASVGVLGGAFAALGATGLRNVIPFFGNLIPSVNPLVAAFVGLMLANEDTRKTFLELGAVLGKFITTILPPLMELFNTLMKDLTPLINAVMKLATVFLMGLGPAITAAAEILTALLRIPGAAWIVSITAALVVGRLAWIAWGKAAVVATETQALTSLGKVKGVVLSAINFVKAHPIILSVAAGAVVGKAVGDKLMGIVRSDLEPQFDAIRKGLAKGFEFRTMGNAFKETSNGLFMLNRELKEALSANWSQFNEGARTAILNLMNASEQKRGIGDLAAAADRTNAAFRILHEEEARVAEASQTVAGAIEQVKQKTEEAGGAIKVFGEMTAEDLMKWGENIKPSFNLVKEAFGELVTTAGITGQQMLTAMMKNFGDMKKWRAGLEELLKKGLPPEFVQQFYDLGPKSLPGLTAFLKLNKAKQDEMVKLFMAGAAGATKTWEDFLRYLETHPAVPVIKAPSMSSQMAKNAKLMAEGGIVRRPTLALIGEAGPEAVVPLKGGFGGRAMRNTIQSDLLGDVHGGVGAATGGGGSPIIVQVQGSVISDNELVRKLREMLLELKRRGVTNLGLT